MVTAHAAASTWFDQVLYRPVFPILSAYGRPVVLSDVSGTGLGVSPYGFFEDGIIQGKVRDDLL